MRGINRLEWLDIITGQGDRHPRNYMIQVWPDLTNTMGSDPIVTAFGTYGKSVRIWYNIVVEMMIEQRTKGISGFDRDILEWIVPEKAFFACHFEMEERV